MKPEDGSVAKVAYTIRSGGTGICKGSTDAEGKLCAKVDPIRVRIRWSGTSKWDYESFAEQNAQRTEQITELPLSNGSRLRLLDGLSAYLVDLGLAKEWAPAGIPGDTASRYGRRPETSLKIHQQGDTILFETRSTRDHVIARNCHPPLPDGMSSSGGGDAVLHPEKSARTKMRTATSADSLAMILEKIGASLPGMPR